MLQPCLFIKFESKPYHIYLILNQTEFILIYRGYGLKTKIPPLHHVFTGNPGTGKFIIVYATLLFLLTFFGCFMILKVKQQLP
jgi:hypothetical protein